MSDTLGRFPCKWGILCLHKTVVHLKQAYKSLNDAIIGWEVHPLTSIWSIRLLNYNAENSQGLPLNIPLIWTGVIKRLVMYTKLLVLPRLWVVNKFKVIYKILNQQLEYNSGSDANIHKGNNEKGQL